MVKVRKPTLICVHIFSELRNFEYFLYYDKNIHPVSRIYDEKHPINKCKFPRDIDYTRNSLNDF